MNTTFKETIDKVLSSKKTHNLIFMKKKLPEIKSFLPPALVRLNGKLLVVPNYIEVPEGTTLEEVREVWIKDEPAPGPGMYCSNEELEIWKAGKWEEYKASKDTEIAEEVLSSNGNKKYLVTLKNGTWSCDCVGFSYRRSCRHIKEIQEKHKQNAA